MYAMVVWEYARVIREYSGGEGSGHQQCTHLDHMRPCPFTQEGHVQHHRLGGDRRVEQEHLAVGPGRDDQAGPALEGELLTVS